MTTKSTTTKKRGRKPSVAKEYYINNNEFYDEIARHLETLKTDPNAGIPEAIWIKFHKLTRRIAMLPKFSGYTYKEEFISDALLLCAMKIDKFNPEKSQNPFAFFTQVITNCYWQAIAGENKEVSKKKSLLALYDISNLELEAPDKYDAIYESGRLVLSEPKAPTDDTIRENAMPVTVFHKGGPKYGF
jgi:hypothetical protein